ncbi:hypothetical protein H6P81_010712 [Aristolochia fimbriata]|uniref:Fe2OG dioxygenase domain-containing protein n=1 Tax=Aristolochia fimbriata TaxID=158543 RepID=A0AAV7ESX6_ARIFI|nr:hypothetical protein H6P81_010712 [Aristolochia fimbriata]
MASSSPIVTQNLPSTTIKHLTETRSLTRLPPNYAHHLGPDDSPLCGTAPSVSLPAIDFSLLASGSPAQRSQLVRDLADACHRWGFFMVVNHGVPEELRTGVMEAVKGFFDLPEEKKREFAGKHVLDPIRCGTSFNTSVDKVLYWRDFLKVFVHPNFHPPSNPSNLRDISLEYSRTVREMVRVLLGGISEGLGLNESYIEKSLNLDEGLQILTGNYYPRCPQPELAMGMPPHSDHGLLTVLIENDVGGLQVMHGGEWVQVRSIPNSFLVNVGDHLEILTNGRYKSVLHRAVVNRENARISIALAHGPSLETLVRPAPELVDDEHHPAGYSEMKYRDYVEFQQSNKLNGKSCLDLVSFCTVKHLTDSCTTLTALPSKYVLPRTEEDPSVSVLTASSSDLSIPTIDFSLLTSGTAAQRSQVIRELGDACREWGFFIVINHGVAEELRVAMLDACRAFFDLPEEEKKEFAGKELLDPIRCGTSFNTSAEEVSYWRDYLKMFVHPDFHCPPKPSSFREISLEYSTCVRKMTRILLEGISESLGLEQGYVEKALDLEHGFQILACNLYPPCPQPELAMGIPPHSDHGLLTVLIENHGGGLQVMHDGMWVQIQTVPNSFLVNVADHLEIVSNGRYKSVLHRAVVNSERTRISIGIANGPPLDALVGPAPALAGSPLHHPAYRKMKYRDYLEFQQSHRLDGNSCLDLVRL